VNHHALTVDVARFQAREFGTSESGGRTYTEGFSLLSSSLLE
jgi:hypothetical protein